MHFHRSRAFFALAGAAIEHICEETNEEIALDRSLLIRAAKCLLAAITRVLLLADIVVVKQLLLAKDKVSTFVLFFFIVLFVLQTRFNIVRGDQLIEDTFCAEDKWNTTEA